MMHSLTPAVQAHAINANHAIPHFPAGAIAEKIKQPLLIFNNSSIFLPFYFLFHYALFCFGVCEYMYSNVNTMGLFLYCHLLRTTVAGHVLNL